MQKLTDIKREVEYFISTYNAIDQIDLNEMSEPHEELIREAMEEARTSRWPLVTKLKIVMAGVSNATTMEISDSKNRESYKKAQRAHKKRTRKNNA